nr:MAG TPA: LONG TAIL FIBER PROTEIN P37 PROTEIN, FIBER PROTEIN.2A [Caudoviricetes sp.]
MPSHNHTVTSQGTVESVYEGSSYHVSVYNKSGTTGTTGNTQSHTHAITDGTHTHTLASGSSITTMPPYYMLVYCVKLL